MIGTHFRCRRKSLSLHSSLTSSSPTALLFMYMHFCRMLLFLFLRFFKSFTAAMICLSKFRRRFPTAADPRACLLPGTVNISTPSHFSLFDQHDQLFACHRFRASHDSHFDSQRNRGERCCSPDEEQERNTPPASRCLSINYGY